MLLTQFVVFAIRSRWAREGRVRRGTNTSEALCSTWTRPRIRGGARGCRGKARFMGRNGCQEKIHCHKQITTNALYSILWLINRFLSTCICWIFRLQLARSNFIVSIAQCHVFTWGRQVTMEENTTAWWAVQFFTQQQAPYCAHAHIHRHKRKHES